MDDEFSSPWLLRLIPREFRDRFAFAAVLAGVPVAILFEFIFVYPTFYDYSSSAFVFYAFLTAVFALNFYGNLYKIMYVDATGRQMSLPHVLKPGWRYCKTSKISIHH